MEQDCKDCRFFFSAEFNEGKGVCRRHAPKVIHGELMARWPFVDETDWCGEFKLDVEREADEDWNKMVAEE